ncbi:MAG: ATP-dependent Clp protease proteolytic subunit [Candidatus Omnitrophica bacterium]|nr:ATP-dependent Clp protease proteolytic subunit [Candidatus Omnitrophota bacterium]
MSREIYLFDIVNSFTAELVIRDLLAYNRESEEEITMFINSPGGSVMSMFAIIDTMKAVESPVRTVVMGDAASAAAIIAACGDKRYMTENSRFMIHEVFGIAIGSVSDMEEGVDMAKREQEKLLKIISNATGKNVDQIKNIIKKKDKFLNSKESLNFGLVDEIIGKDSANVIKLSEGINVEGYEIAVNSDGHSKVQLLLEGNYEHPSYGSIKVTEDVLNKLITNFKDNVRGIDLSIDYTHDNDNGEKPAACWIKDLSVENTDKGKGLFASVEFTSKGKNLVKEKEYKYASADFAINYMTDKGECVPYVLLGGTLTNRPFIKEMSPIKLSETQPKEKKNMSLETLFAELKNNHGVDVKALQENNETLKNQISTLEGKVRELNKLPAEKEEEIKNLKEQINGLEKSIEDNKKEAVFNELLESAKVTPAQKDMILNKFDKAEEITEFYKDAPVVVNTKKNGEEDSNNQGLSEEEQKLVNQGVYTVEEVKKYKGSISRN